jgi:2-polyprenyl-6-methoxyphenol hydroxylase-like FAD-dependent oxidoreductase
VLHTATVSHVETFDGYAPESYSTGAYDSGSYSSAYPAGSFKLEADLVVGADGVRSAVRGAMESDPEGVKVRTSAVLGL